MLRHEVEHDWVRQVRRLVHRAVSSSWELDEVLTTDKSTQAGDVVGCRRDNRNCAMANIMGPVPSPEPPQGEQNCRNREKKLAWGWGRMGRDTPVLHAWNPYLNRVEVCKSPALFNRLPRILIPPRDHHGDLDIRKKIFRQGAAGVRYEVKENLRAMQQQRIESMLA